MKQQNMVWRLNEPWIEIDGQQTPIHILPHASRCRRVAAAVNVKVPPFSEIDVEAYTILPNLTASGAQWATQPTVLENGLWVAGTLLPGRTRDLTLRILNPTNHTIKLKKGVRCDVEEVLLPGSAAKDERAARCSTIRQMSPDDDAETVLKPLWEAAADDVPQEYREKLRALLMKHR
jgi:hypothetical protein